VNQDSLPLLLLPGMMCDARLFRPQIEALADHYPVFVANLFEGETIEALATTILSKISAREFALGGLSMGALLPWRCSAKPPSGSKKLLSWTPILRQN
jgi:pimeloyl-ACP methyl ester carboxylesterase